ncbi:hypothetical protein CP532_5168 [Ophiocordyceps camponoti-leonardi (nom. inval.)]|nr:hypothetical protein CP532_5168 [Ophiocordyceps camponoti-leonardi (nom. inval.)]
MSSSRASPTDASSSPKRTVVNIEPEEDAAPAAEESSPRQGSTLAKDEREAKAMPDEAAADGPPPLPDEPIPQQADDGWTYEWDNVAQNWYFSNRFTGVRQWENPRVPAAASTVAASEPPPPVPTNERPAAGGYNPAIHGDYDPNAWYAQAYNQDQEQQQQALVGIPSFADPAAVAYGVSAGFNRFTGQFQAPGAGPQRHSDEAKARRQMNAFFDVDAAANAHDGRSLKAERQNQKLSKSELKAYKEKRRAKKEEKRRAWLKD